MKHRGMKVMVWECFTYYDVDPIYKIGGIMGQHKYVQILNEVMFLCPEHTDNIPFKWIFMQDNDHKYTTKTVKRWFRKNKVEVMELVGRPSQASTLLKTFWQILRKFYPRLSQKLLLNYGN